MRWGSFIFGLLFLLFALSDIVIFIIFILPALLLLLNGLRESDSEKLQKKQIDETRRMRHDIQTIKNSDVTKEQAKEIQNLKKEIDELKKGKKHKNKEKNEDEDSHWSCDYCNKEFNTKKDALVHEKTCIKRKK